MIDPNTINDLSDKLFAALPDSAVTIATDIKQNIHSILQSSLGQLDLVTREEFDAQVQVLQRTRQKLQALERQLDELKV